ncbi:MAG: TldD/PmbA family protein, partial [Candidatus Weimeria sp.]
MMLKDILDILKSSDADAWAVDSQKINRWEFYFIKHDLDQNRAIDTTHINITVYKKSDDGKYLGSASDEIAPSASEEEITD